MVKEVWTHGELQTIGNFTESLQEFLQEWGAGNGIFIRDVAITIADEDPRHRGAWGLVSIQNYEDTILQFEPGEFDSVGPS